jgi:hypothetical protein
MDWKQTLATGFALAMLVTPLSYCQVQSERVGADLEKACAAKGWAINWRNDCAPIEGQKP